MDFLFVDFLNSEFRDFRGRWQEDRLLQPQWFADFCARRGFRLASPPDAAILADFIRARAHLRGMAEKIAGGQQLSFADLGLLNSLQVSTPVTRQLIREEQHYRQELVPLQKDWSWVQAEIAASFAEFLTDHDLRRLKICANAHCRAFFYDESKNRTATLCSEKCSNLLKAQRFRARQPRKTTQSQQTSNASTEQLEPPQQ
jgi:predicted RNA-binding Zn ribbon-like protein